MDQSSLKFIKSYERSLLIYIAALSMIIALISTSFFIERRMLRSQKKFAAIINISGKQRMLSQRLAMLALQPNDVKNRELLKASSTELRRYHLALSEDGFTELNTKQISAINTINKDVMNAFFNSIDLLTSETNSNEAFNKQIVTDIVRLSTGPLLTLFEKQTMERENKATEILSDYLEVKYFLYLCTIILIFAEGLLIFYPMAKRNLQSSLEIIDLHRTEEKMKKFSELGEVFSTTIHEINNPLAVAIAKNNLLIKKGEISDEVKGALVIIDKNLERISKIIRSTKAIYRKGDNDPDGPVLLGRVMSEAVESAAILRCLKSVNVTIEEKSEIVVKAKEHQIFQVFLNLIVNAVDALKDDDINDPKITIELFKERNLAICRFIDNGKGVSAENEEKVFQSLYTTKLHGTGMGLTECKRIVESYHGKIFINHSISDSTFEVQFPCS